MRQLRTIPELGCNLIQILRTQIHTDGLAGERNMTRPKATHNNTTATKGVKKVNRLVTASLTITFDGSNVSRQLMLPGGKLRLARCTYQVVNKRQNVFCWWH